MNSNKINHYTAIQEFKLLYFDIINAQDESKDYLNQMIKHLDSLGKRVSEMKIYSEDFFDLYYFHSFESIFTNHFVVATVSHIEAYLKEYAYKWIDLHGLNEKKEELFRNNLWEEFKKFNKTHPKIKIDFKHPSIINFIELIHLRNVIVHSSNNLEFNKKYYPSIKSLSKKFPSIKIYGDDIFIGIDFCKIGISISRKFLYYIFKKTIRLFPNGSLDKASSKYSDF